jgi:MFS transporter, DHA1 family, inner membrane transport protein
MIVMGISGASMMVIMPGVFAALASGRALGPDSVAWLAFGEMTGITIATFGVSFKIQSLDHRRIAAVALLILALADATSAELGSLLPLVSTRLIAGLAEGTLIVSMASLIAMTPQPDRLFALYMACNLGTSTILLAILGVLITADHGRLIFYVLIIVISAAAAMLGWLPAKKGEPRERGRLAPHSVSVDVTGQVVGLLGTLVLFVGLGASWPQVGEVGHALRLPLGAVPFAMSVATFMGILSGLLAALCGARFGRRVPLICGTLMLALSMMLVATAANRTGFTVAVAAYMFSWIYIVPYYTGVMARLDSYGQMASFSMATQFLGLALGPLVSTLLIRQGLSPIFWLAAGCCVPALGLMLVAEARGRLTGP